VSLNTFIACIKFSTYHFASCWGTSIGQIWIPLWV